MDIKYDAYSLVEKIKHGKPLNIDEKKYLEDGIQNPSSENDLYDLIRGFCAAFHPTNDNVKHVEKFLSFDVDDIVLSAAIMGLCSYWGLTNNYLPFLKELLNKEKAYDYSDSQIAALSVLGTYIYISKDNDLLSFLFTLFKTELEEYERGGKEHFYKARLGNLYDALRKGVRMEKSSWNNIDFPRDVDKSLMRDIEARIKKRAPS